MVMLLYLLAGMLCLVAYQHSDSWILTEGPLGRVRACLTFVSTNLSVPLVNFSVAF